MFLDGLTNADALPVLERSVQFAARRHTLILHNIANLSTPNFRPLDVSIADFRQSLARAVDERRLDQGSRQGDLPLESTRQVRIDPRGGLRLEPQPSGESVLFHDRNDRNLERIMQDLAENSAAFRVSAELFKTRLNLLESAIRERL